MKHKMSKALKITLGVLAIGGIGSTCIVPLTSCASSTVNVISVKLDQESMEVLVGESKKLTATVLPNNASDQSIEWSTSDNSIASVDQSGNVNGVKEGEATITAKSKNGITKTCKVVVKDVIIVTDYESTLEWVKNNYGEGTEEDKVIVPKKSSSSWRFGGYVEDCSGNNLTYCKNHLKTLLKSLTQLSSETVESTLVDESKCAKDEYGFSSNIEGTSGILESLAGAWSEENSYKKLTETSFKELINIFYSGISKYNATYIINDTKKTLTVGGTLSYVKEEDQGTSFIRVPNFYITYDSFGRLANFSVSCSNDLNCSFSWESKEKVEYSAGFQFTIYASSAINVDLVY